MHRLSNQPNHVPPPARNRSNANYAAKTQILDRFNSAHPTP
jgi:hypothetical protein